MNLRYVAVKALRALVTVWLVLTFVFVVLRLSGDPATMLLPDDIDPQTIELYQQRWGLDRPLWEQYVSYFESAAEGSFGISFRDRRPALEVILERLPATLELGLFSFAFAIVFGIPLGVVAALKRNTLFDRLAMGFAVLGYAMPYFFMGVLLILLFSLQLRWLPSSGSSTWWHLIMPVLTLGTTPAAMFARFTRSSVLEVLNKPFIRTARAKGALPWREIVFHALPNAAIPVVTVMGLRLGEMIGGAVVTETVFAWPGMGRLLVGAVANRDLAVVQGIVVLIAISMVTVNLLIDLAYGWLDPRIRTARSEALGGSRA
jgi:peptide/nickel transport system permease protein